MLKRKSNTIITLLIVIFLISCSGDKPEPSGGLINIDVLEAFKTQKSLKGSDFIKDVELIPLESSRDAYFRIAYSYSIGEKYIMIADAERAQMVLFDRKGKFIRAIGKKGKGPGEFSEPRQAAMDPSEMFIFIADVGTSKLVKYSIEGDFVNEISIKEISPARYINGIEFINDNQFVLVNRRPYAPMDGFASLPLFDMNLNLIENILPRANDENLRINIEPHAVFTANPERMTFWEPFSDTLYTITSGGEATPTHVVGFSKGGPDRKFVLTNINPNLYAENSIVSIMDVGQYMHIFGMKDNEWFSALYNKKTKEIFEVSRAATCYTSSDSNPYGMENDLYGAGYIWLRHYSAKIDRFISLVDPDGIAEYYDLNCIRDKKVKYPKLRDRFLEIVEDPEAPYQKIIVLMKLK